MKTILASMCALLLASCTSPVNTNETHCIITPTTYSCVLEFNKDLITGTSTIK